MTENDFECFAKTAVKSLETVSPSLCCSVGPGRCNPATRTFSDLTTLGFGIRSYAERITSSPLSDPLN